MRAQVVYESMFGNTMLVAEAIAEGIARHGDVQVIEVGMAGRPPRDLDLLVVGGPTQAFGLSRPVTRQDAARHATAGIISGRIGLREWILSLADTPRLSAPVAVFDTKIVMPGWLPGSAARSAVRLLRQMRVPILVRPESFYVNAILGPLADGELTRAKHWGDWVARLSTPGGFVEQTLQAAGARRV